VPYDGFFSMVILGMVYHWMYGTHHHHHPSPRHVPTAPRLTTPPAPFSCPTSYLYSLPWSVPVCTYVMGGVWTLMIVVDKRLHLETLTVQQQNSHVMIICGYVAVFLSHYVMQVRH
jgi:hypothetical protein